jgi:hypothetical protein
VLVLVLALILVLVLVLVLMLVMAIFSSLLAAADAQAEPLLEEALAERAGTTDAIGVAALRTSFVVLQAGALVWRRPITPVVVLAVRVRVAVALVVARALRVLGLAVVLLEVGVRTSAVLRRWLLRRVGVAALALMLVQPLLMKVQCLR